jgi:predicted small secreted protein
MEILMAKKFAAAALVLMALAGCNTMEGLGKDTTAAGKAVENSAEKNKGY